MVPRLALQKEFPEWLLNMLRGELALDLAWKKRGSGFAAEVTPEGWGGFTQHLAEARKHLTAAWRARPDQSRSAGLMVTVTMAGDTNGNETPRLWFDRATESTVDSASAFINYRRSLLPRWGGSYRAMMDFATQCVKSKRFDTRVPEALTDVLEDIAAEQKDSRAAYRMPGVPALVREMNEGYLAAADTAQHRADRFALLMVDSWLSGDCRTAYEMLEAFGLPMSSAAQHRIEKLSVSWNQLLAEVVLYGGPGGDIARQADALEQAGKPEEALPLWQQWQTLTKPQPWVKTQGAVRLRAAERRRDYANGNWVELPVDGPRDWDRPLGTWELDEKAGLVAVGDGESVAYTAVYPLSTGPHFECRTKFRITGTPVQPNSQDPYIQIHTGFKPWSFYAATTATLAMDMGAKSISAYLSQNSATEPASDTVDLAVDPGGEIELLFRRTDQGLTLTVNGKPVLKNWEETPGDPDFEKGYFALGAQGLQVGTKLTILSTALHRLP
ncbi:MAG: hypothetical protein JWL81_746 [Verrucomicrobiales bacterium]|nr:hypothetical protein [Verrucomicrobiales bacterium]